MTLWPGESAVLSVLGVGGPCAAAPGDAAVGGTSGFASIPLVLDVAGFGYVEDVPITLVEVASTESCPRPDRSGTSTSSAAGPSPCRVERIGVRQRRHGRPPRP